MQHARRPVAPARGMDRLARRMGDAADNRGLSPPEKRGPHFEPNPTMRSGARRRSDASRYSRPVTRCSASLIVNGVTRIWADVR
jgi:hypothetical protein